MPHLRKRHLEDALAKVLAFSPLVGVLGHRQVGKTTLLEKFSASYFSLDQKRELEAATADPALYLRSKTKAPVALDECQWAPELFPALKDRVRISKKPGQYLLSGSIRFTSKKAIRESLTGRISNLELLPFSIAELENAPLPRVFVDLLEARDFSGLALPSTLPAREQERRMKLCQTYFSRGGLPGICMMREDVLRGQRLEDQFETLLERDLRQILPTTLPYLRLVRLCRVLAENQGEPLHWSELQRSTKISVPTLRRLLSALEAIFLIRLLPLEGGRKGEVLFFEDQGETAHLLRGGETAARQWIHFLYLQSRVQFMYRMEQQAEFFQYRTRGGALIPLAMRTAKGVLGLMWSESGELTHSQHMTAQSFLKSYVNSKIVVAQAGPEWARPTSRLVIAPVSQLILA